MLIGLIVGLLVANVILLLVAWGLLTSGIFGPGYNHYDKETGLPNPASEYTDGHVQNAWALSFYLFGPFWMLYFVIGAALAFLYDATRPAEKHNAWIWGWVADACALITIGLS